MEIKTADNDTQGIERVSGTSPKTNRIIFYFINLFILLPALIKNASLIGLAAASVLLFVLFAVSVLPDRGFEPAGAQITVLLFFDILVQLALDYEVLISGFYPDHLRQDVQLYIHSPLCIVLTGVGVVLGIIGIWCRFFWMTSFSGTALGAAVILPFWSNGSLDSFQFIPGGAKNLAAFLLCAFIWILLSRIVLYAAPRKWGLNIFLGILLLCGIAALYLLEPIYVWSLYEKLPDAFWTQGKANLVCGVLLGCALVMANNGTERANFDASAVLACAVFIYAVQFLACTYCIVNWLLLLPLTASMLRCLNNTAADNPTLGFRPLTYMIIQTAAFFFSAEAFKMGLYINVILAAVTGLALWLLRTKKQPEKFQDFFCGKWIAFFAAEALAWQWRMRFSREGVIMLAVIFLMAMGVLLLVSFPHPDKLRASQFLRVCVCACAGILCLISMIPTLWIQAEVQESEAYIEIKALNGSAVAEASYCWKDWRGQAVEEAELRQQTAILPIRGNILTITAVDEKGVRSNRDFWYPVWPHLS